MGGGLGAGIPGVATLALNVVGHGGGELGTLQIQTASQGEVVVPAGGRGIDQDGNQVIDSTEGSSAIEPWSAISSRDALRQTVIDLMQLVRQVEVGMDVDGDGSADLDRRRIYYAGQSFVAFTAPSSWVLSRMFRRVCRMCPVGRLSRWRDWGPFAC
ncbi:MAG: hypothetical protein R3E42_15675 [Burkholderiaceae bacterium]